MAIFTLTRPLILASASPRRAALLLLRRVRSVLPSLVLGDALLEILQSEL